MTIDYCQSTSWFVSSGQKFRYTGTVPWIWTHLEHGTPTLMGCKCRSDCWVHILILTRCAETTRMSETWNSRSPCWLTEDRTRFVPFTGPDGAEQSEWEPCCVWGDENRTERMIHVKTEWKQKLNKVQVLGMFGSTGFLLVLLCVTTEPPCSVCTNTTLSVRISVERHMNLVFKQ